MRLRGARQRGALLLLRAFLGAFFGAFRAVLGAFLRLRGALLLLRALLLVRGAVAAEGFS